MEYDVFISHASEDKASVARPLANALEELDLRVWLDEMELTLGDSLRRTIDHGLSLSKFGVVILSHSFFQKEWPQKELDGLVARENSANKVILPIWHNVTHEDVVLFSPTLADRLSVSTEKGIDEVARMIHIAVTKGSSSIENSAKTEYPNSKKSSLRAFTIAKNDLPAISVYLLISLVLLGAGYFYIQGRFTSLQVAIEQPPQEESVETNLPLPATGYISFSSEPGDYIGQGQKHEFSDDNGLFSMSGDRNFITIYFEGDDHWSFEFAAPRDKELQVGKYSSAQRAAFHNPVKPGIDISGAGRGCNEINGEFLIKEITFSSSDTLERFVAEFEQHCEDAAPKLEGEINITAKDN